MSQGGTRPYGHQGLVDGGEEGSPTPPTSSFLSTIYAAGLADDPSVDNLMTGPLQAFFVNLGATPPPFPGDVPYWDPFFPESALFVGETPADSGVGADSKPLWRMRRWFSTFPSVGDQIHFETRYDLFGSGVNSITGGDRNLHILVDQFGNRLAFGYDEWQLTRPGLNAPGYTPIYLDGSPITYHQWQLMDALGGGNSNNWHFDSDGNQFRRVFIPNVVGGGGGPAGPWSYVADAMSMWSRNGGEPLVGSRLYYDTITVQTFSGIDDSDTHLIVGQAAVLDAKNLASGLAAGHGETYVRSTLGGLWTLVASFYDDGYIFPEGLASTGPATFDDAVFFNSTVNDGQLVQSFSSGDLDLATTHSGIVLIPARPGFFPVMTSRNWTIKAFSGTQSTAAQSRAGSDGGHVNFFTLTAAPTNAEVTGTPPNLAAGPGFPALSTTRIPNADIIMDVPTAATGTGGFALTAELTVVVFWQAA